jgi:hypothetical protein
MKKLIVIMAVLLSLNLYGDPTRNMPRLFSPVPEDESARKDLSDVLFLKLEQNPELKIKLKKEFARSFERYKNSLVPSVATQTCADGKITQALECTQEVYMQFAYDLISQLSQLGYAADVIYCVEGRAIHDNRQNLLYCWLEVNFLDKYGNKFFSGTKSDYEQPQAVKNLYQIMLPGFCMAVSQIRANK